MKKVIGDDVKNDLTYPKITPVTVFKLRCCVKHGTRCTMHAHRSIGLSVCLLCTIPIHLWSDYPECTKYTDNLSWINL